MRVCDGIHSYVNSCPPACPGQLSLTGALCSGEPFGARSALQAYAEQLVAARIEDAIAITIIEGNLYLEFGVIERISIADRAKRPAFAVHESPRLYIEIPMATWDGSRFVSAKLADVIVRRFEHQTHRIAAVEAGDAG